MLAFNNFQQTIIQILMAIYIIFFLPLTACSKIQSEAQPTPTQTETVQVSGETVRVGILVIDSAVSVHQRYSPLLSYLSQVTSRPFELVPLTQETQLAQVAEGKLDFILHNPLAAVQVRRLYNTKFIVTLSRPQTGSKFSGLIIVRSDSEIHKLEDLKSKQAACVDFQTAAGGCVFQIYYLQQNGIDPFTEFSSFVENQSQSNITLAVLNGTIDVGFIRTGQLEKMVSQGLINKTDDIRVLEAIQDEFPYEHTTQLYPEWPFAALSSTNPKLVAAVKEALLNLPANHQALVAANLESFVPATDYTEFDELIETLKLKTWNVN
ncbi:MAG: phosphate/phosphite/phosphonate ABC transporter substrate-binding protein [Symploca sp. SIO2E9]|nr:phosphate/phosphite/phosphonate ABC transporter substrate-binding protein [Symploca sp. SIO2E9]